MIVGENLVSSNCISCKIVPYCMAFTLYSQYIQFARLVHQTGPMLVHCSAGIGRTGVLITVDIITGMIDKDLKVSTTKFCYHALGFI